MWILPPWKSNTDKSAFEMSWDVTEAFFENGAVESARVRPICGLIAELREAGFDSALRAGQSLYSLELSRSREHELRPEQSYIFLSPDRDGRVAVEGKLGQRKIKFGPVDATLVGSLREVVDALTLVEVD